MINPITNFVNRVSETLDRLGQIVENPAELETLLEQVNTIQNNSPLQSIDVSLLNNIPDDLSRLMGQSNALGDIISASPLPTFSEELTPQERITLDLAIQTAAQGLDPALIDMFMRGEIWLKIFPRYDNDQQLVGYTIKVYYEQASEVAVIYNRDENNGIPVMLSDTTTQITTFLQRFLLGNHYFRSRDEFQEGIFCQNTLAAFRAYQNQHNLSSVNTETAWQALEQRADRAREDYYRYLASDASQTNDFQRYLRYELARKALNQIASLVGSANQYLGMPLEPEFIADVNELAAEFNPLIRELFNEVLLDRYAFSDIEFTINYDNDLLWEAINPDLYSGYPSEYFTSENSVENLNDLLKITNLYERFERFLPDLPLVFDRNSEAADLISETRGYRGQGFGSLSQEQQYNIRRLNRLLLETAYPAVCPPGGLYLFNLDSSSFDTSIDDYLDPESDENIADRSSSSRAGGRAEDFNSAINSGINILSQLRNWQSLAELYAPEFSTLLSATMEDYTQRLAYTFSYFYAREFNTDNPADPAIRRLYSQITSDLAGLGGSVQPENEEERGNITSLELINRILCRSDFYTRWIAVHEGDLETLLSGQTEETQATIRELIGQTAGYRDESFSSLSPLEKLRIVTLNRLLMQITYSDVPLRPGIIEIPEHISEQAENIDYDVFSEIQALATPESRDPVVVRRRNAVALRILSSLSGNPDLNRSSLPALPEIIAYSRGYLQDESLDNLERVFTTFSRLIGDLSSNPDVSGSQDTLEGVVQYFLRDNASSSINGVGVGVPGGDRFRDQNRAIDRFFRDRPDDLRQDVLTFTMRLYAFVNSQNDYAESERGRQAGAQTIDFENANSLALALYAQLAVYQTELEAEYGVNDSSLTDEVRAERQARVASEINATLRILENLPDDLVNATQQLQQQQESDLDILDLRSGDQTRQFAGVSPFTISSRDISFLAQESGESRGWNGIISSEDLQYLMSDPLVEAEDRPDIQRQFSQRNAAPRAGDYFYISALGITPVSQEAITEIRGTAPRLIIDVPRYFGTIESLRPQEALEYHPASVLGLIISQFAPLTNGEFIAVAGIPVDHLSGNDIARGIPLVFGESDTWLFRPNSFILDPTTTRFLNTFAQNLVVNSNPITVSGSQMTREQRLVLENAMGLLNSEVERLDDAEYSSLYLPFTEDELALLTQASEICANINNLSSEGQAIISIFNGDAEIRQVQDGIAFLEDLVWGNSATVAETLRRAISASSSTSLEFSRLERQALTNYFNELDTPVGSALISYNNLSETERDELRDVAVLFINELSHMDHKNGFDLASQRALRELGHYLGDELFIGSRELLVYDRDREDALVAQLGRSDPDFNEASFRAIYRSGIGILQETRDDLIALLNKYPPPDRGFSGWGELAHHALSLAAESLDEVASPAAQTLALSSGADQTTLIAINLIAHPELEAAIAGNTNDIQAAEERLSQTEAELRAIYSDYDIEAGTPVLVGLTGYCMTLREGLNGNYQELTGLMQTLGDGSGEERLKGHIRYYIGMLDRFSGYGSYPPNIINEAEALRQQIQTELDILNVALSGSPISDRDEGVMREIHANLTSFYDVLGDIAEARAALTPIYEEIRDAERELQRNMSRATSDGLDAEEWATLRGRLERIVDPDIGNRILSGAFLGQLPTVVGPGGDTSLTAVELIDAFFADNPGEEVYLQNLRIEVGAGQINDVRIAFSQILQKVNLQQYLEPLGILGGLASFANSYLGTRMPHVNLISAIVGALSSTAGDPLQVQYFDGPPNIDDILAHANDGLLQAFYTLFSGLGYSTNSNPPRNIVPEFFMYMNPTPEGQLASAEAISSTPQQYLTADALEAFFADLRMNFLPRFNVSSFRETVSDLNERLLVPIDLLSYIDIGSNDQGEEVVNLDRLNRALTDWQTSFAAYLRDNNLTGTGTMITDWQHADPGPLRDIAALFQAYAAIDTATYQNDPIADIANYSLASLDLMRILGSSWTRCQAESCDDLEAVRIFIPDPEATEIEEVGYLATTTSHRALDLAMGGDTLSDFSFEEDFHWNVVGESSVSMLASLLTMPITITGGMYDTGALSGSFIWSVGDYFFGDGTTHEMYQAGLPLLKTAVRTGISFSFFESFRKGFYASAFFKLLAGDVDGAFGDFLGILAFNTIMETTQHYRQRSQARQNPVIYEDRAPLRTGLVRRAIGADFFEGIVRNARNAYGEEGLGVRDYAYRATRGLLWRTPLNTIRGLAGIGINFAKLPLWLATSPLNLANRGISRLTGDNVITDGVDTIFEAITPRHRNARLQEAFQGNKEIRRTGGSISTGSHLADAFHNIGMREARSFADSLRQSGVRTFYTEPNVVFESGDLTRIVNELSHANATGRTVIIQRGSNGRPAVRYDLNLPPNVRLEVLGTHGRVFISSDVTYRLTISTAPADSRGRIPFSGPIVLGEIDAAGNFRRSGELPADTELSTRIIAARDAVSESFSTATPVATPTAREIPREVNERAVREYCSVEVVEPDPLRGETEPRYRFIDAATGQRMETYRFINGELVPISEMVPPPAPEVAVVEAPAPEAVAASTLAGDQLEATREILGRMGIPEERIGQITTREAFLEAVGEQFGNRLPSWLEALRSGSPERYNEIVAEIVRSQTLTRGGRALAFGGNLAIAVMSFLGIEEILDVCGVENEAARFVIVIGGAHLVTSGSSYLIQESLTPMGRARLSELRRTLAPSLRRGLERVTLGSMAGGTGRLAVGVGYAILATNVYNGILDGAGVSEDSWLRGRFAQFTVGMGVPGLVQWGGKTLLGTAERTVIGRAAIPLAVTHLISTGINFFDSDYEQSVQERAQDAMRLELAGGGTGYQLLLAGDIVANTISGGAFGEVATDEAALDQIAREDAIQIGALLPQAQITLGSLLLPGLLDYDGSARGPSFFTNPERVNSEFRFDNYRPILATVDPVYGETHDFLHIPIPSDLLTTGMDMGMGQFTMLPNSTFEPVSLPLLGMGTSSSPTASSPTAYLIHIADDEGGSQPLDQFADRFAIDTQTLFDSAVPGNGGYYLVQPGGALSIYSPGTIYGSAVREADALEFVVDAPGSPGLYQTLRQAYNIPDPAVFLDQVSIYQENVPGVSEGQLQGVIGLLGENIEFRNHYEQEEPVSECDIGGCFTFTLHSGAHIREADAYEYIMNQGGEGAGSESLIQTLSGEYHIPDPEEFLERVEAKNLQDLIAYLVFLDPESIDPFIVGLDGHRALRRIFDRDGVLIEGMEGELIGWLSDDVRESVATFRRFRRLQALMVEGAEPNYVDRQLGLVNEDGAINENSAEYAIFVRTFGQGLPGMLTAMGNN